MTSLHGIYGFNPPPQSKILATPMPGAGAGAEQLFLISFGASRSNDRIAKSYEVGAGEPSKFALLQHPALDIIYFSSHTSVVFRLFPT